MAGLEYVTDPPRCGVVNCGVSFGMRSFMATSLFFLQLQPLVGVALCSAMGGNDGARMEAGCPMPESTAALDYRAAGWTAPSTSHDCVLAEACAPAPTIVYSVRPEIVSLPIQVESSPRFPDLDLPIAVRSPPVPPPKP